MAQPTVDQRPLDRVLTLPGSQAVGVTGGAAVARMQRPIGRRRVGVVPQDRLHVMPEADALQKHKKGEDHQR